jgi:hypothetical protein
MIVVNDRCIGLFLGGGIELIQTKNVGGFYRESRRLFQCFKKILAILIDTAIGDAKIHKEQMGLGSQW